MPTANITVTPAWSQVAADTDDHLLLTWRSAARIEFATTAAAAAPTVTGHTLTSSDAVTRDALGNGFVWARISPRSNETSALVVVTL